MKLSVPSTWKQRHTTVFKQINTITLVINNNACDKGKVYGV